MSGNLITLAKTGHFDVIAHGCNCFCTMGAGIAKGIKTSFPAAWEVDLKTKPGDRSKLGTCTSAVVSTTAGELTVVNAYTQFDWRGTGLKADYRAITTCMDWIGSHYQGKRIGLPKIGAGLAGGDWNRIMDIIERSLGRHDLTIVEYEVLKPA